MNKLFDFGRESFLDGQISWTTHTIRAVLLDVTQYTVDLHTNRWLADIPAEAQIAISAPLSSKVVTDGAADADDATFTSVTGPEVKALALFRDTGVPSTSRLIAYIDNATGLPVTPDGGNIKITWDSGINKIFKL